MASPAPKKILRISDLGKCASSHSSLPWGMVISQEQVQHRRQKLARQGQAIPCRGRLGPLHHLAWAQVMRGQVVGLNLLEVELRASTETPPNGAALRAGLGQGKLVVDCTNFQVSHNPQNVGLICRRYIWARFPLVLASTALYASIISDLPPS